MLKISSSLILSLYSYTRKNFYKNAGTTSVPASLLSPLRLAHPVEDVGQLLGVFLQLLIAPLQFVVAALELAVLLVGGQLAFHRPQLQVVGLDHVGCAVERLRGLGRAVREYLVIWSRSLVLNIFIRAFCTAPPLPESAAGAA